MIRCSILFVIAVFLFAACGLFPKPDDPKNAKPYKNPVFPHESFLIKEIPAVAFDRLDTLPQSLKNMYSDFEKISRRRFDDTLVKGFAHPLGIGRTLFYYDNKDLQKISCRTLTETSQFLTEFYLKNGQLFLVRERSCLYDRPIGYDSVSIVHNHEMDFSPEKHGIQETIDFFQGDALLRSMPLKEKGIYRGKIYLLLIEKRLLQEFNAALNLAGRS
jgi:hypothetical protein